MNKIFLHTFYYILFIDSTYVIEEFSLRSDKVNIARCRSHSTISMWHS
jgi:hypothetical protein